MRVAPRMMIEKTSDETGRVERQILVDGVGAQPLGRQPRRGGGAGGQQHPHIVAGALQRLDAPGRDFAEEDVEGREGDKKDVHALA